MIEQELSRRGLLTLANGAGPFTETLLVDAAGSPPEEGTPPALGQVTRITLPVRYPGTPVETVGLADVARLRDDLVRRLRAAK